MNLSTRSMLLRSGAHYRFGVTTSIPCQSLLIRLWMSEAQDQPKPFSEMPGVTSIFKSIPMLMKERKKEPGYDNDNLFMELHKEHGDIFRFRMPGNWMVSIRSPDEIEKLLRAEGEYPSRGPYEANVMWIYNKLNLPPPLVLSSGKVWKKARSFAAKQVVPRRVGNFVDPLCEIADNFIEHLESLMDESGNVADVTPEVNKWAFQGASYFVYGQKINTYSTTDPVQQEFIEASRDYIRSFPEIASAPPIYKIFPTKAYKKYVKIVHRIHNAGGNILLDRAEKLKEEIASGEVDETKAVGLLDQWMIEGKFTHDESLLQSYDMLSAGIDTTGNSSAFLLYELAKHPAIQDNLVQEIRSVLGDRVNPSWEDLQKMPLLRNCIKESMRLYVPLTAISRSLAQKAVLCGYEVPAGVGTVVELASMSKDERLFKDPVSFIPERWNKGVEDKIHPFSSLPFGFGPRSCYGRRFAEMEMFVLMVKMLPKYKLSTNIKDIKRTRAHVFMQPSEPLQIRFSNRF